MLLEHLSKKDYLVLMKEPGLHGILTAHSDLITAVVDTFREEGALSFACKLINNYFPLLILCSPISPLFHQGGATS
jgi:hypothetical protein